MPRIDVEKCLWLLKNSLRKNPEKLLGVRNLYKRFFPVSRTFSITRFSIFFGKPDFFNSHRDYHYLSRFEISGSYPDQQGSNDCPISLPKCPLKRAEGEGFDLLAPAAVDVASTASRNPGRL